MATYTMADFESDHEEFPPSTEEFTGASQTSGSSIYLNKFERFKELPTELRLKIWKYASFFQRNVDVLPFTVYDERAMDNKSFMIPDVYISSCPAPALLHVCRESRNEGLKYYTADFGTEEPVLLRICGRRKTVPIPTPVIHINWDVDRVCVPSPSYFRDENADLLPPQEETPLDRLTDLLWQKGVKSLALNIYEPRDEHYAVCLVRPYMLEEIILFSWPRKDAWNLESYDFEDVADDDVEDWLHLQQQILDRVDGCNSSYEEPPDPPNITPRVRFCELVNVRLRSEADS